MNSLVASILYINKDLHPYIFSISGSAIAPAEYRRQRVSYLNSITHLEDEEQVNWLTPCFNSFMKKMLARQLLK
jgi:hypothetical protein